MDASLPSRHSSMTILSPAAPNLPANEALTASPASSRVWAMATPLPAAAPWAHAPPLPGGPKRAGGRGPHGLLGLVAVVGDGDALARGGAIGLYHDREVAAG